MSLSSTVAIPRKPSTYFNHWKEAVDVIIIHISYELGGSKESGHEGRLGVLELVKSHQGIYRFPSLPSLFPKHAFLSLSERFLFSTVLFLSIRHQYNKEWNESTMTKKLIRSATLKGEEQLV